MIKHQLRPAFSIRLPSLDPGLVFISAIAVFMRCWRPGLYQIVWDEVNLLFRSQRLAQYGDWVWLSNRTSWMVIPGHSPFSNYVLALPYLFTSDPRAARLLVGVMGVIAVILVYLTVRRYCGRAAALMTGLLFAASIHAVEWSRFVWNPNLAQPFIALWLLTGLLGYYEGKKWAQVVHWGALSLAAQAHIANAALGLPSLILLMAAWRRRTTRASSARDEAVRGAGAQHAASLRFTVVGWLLAALTLIPWGIGLFEAGFLQNVDPVVVEDVAPPPLTLEGMVNKFIGVVSAPLYNMTARGSSAPGEWFPPVWTEYPLRAQGWLALIGVAGALVWAGGSVVRGRAVSLPLVMFAATALSPLLLKLFAPVTVENFYVMAILFGAYPLLGALLARLAGYSSAAPALLPVRRVIAWGLVLFWAGLHGWTLIGQFRWLDVGAWQEPLRAPLDTFIAQVNDWNQQGDLVLLVETPTIKYTLPDMQIAFWEVVAAGQPIRVINRWFEQGIPVAGDRPAVVVGLRDGATIPRLFGAGELVGATYRGEPVFRQVVLDDFALPLDLTPETISRFNNGAHIIGVHADAAPRAGENWDMTLIWQPERSTDRNYQFSLRLIDSDGANRYGQRDFPSLDLSEWRAGDTVYNPVSLPAADNLPDGYRPRLEILMYTLDDLRSADAVDDAGSSVAPWIYLR